MLARLRLRRAVATVTLVVLLALPVAAVAHPDHGPQAAPHAEQESGGGTSPALIAGIVVGVIATAGVLYALKVVQNRLPEPEPSAGAGPEPEPPASGPGVGDAGAAARG